MPPSTRLTTIFTKLPEPGRVKTRLVPPLTPEQASELALAMLDDVVARHARSADYSTGLAVTPAGSEPWFRRRYPGLALAPQEGAGLGERLARWFEARCASPDGGRTVVVVGADVPLLGSSVVARAHALLEEGADLVLAPDGGGGYGLVGLARGVRALFSEVPMSAGDMLARTIDVARGLDLRVQLLPPHQDVDTEEDLLRLARELNTAVQDGAAQPEFPVRTHAFLREVLAGSGA